MANRRFRTAVEQGDVVAAVDTDDEFHAVPVMVAANRALAAVLAQFTLVCSGARNDCGSSSWRARRSKIIDDHWHWDASDRR